MTDFLKEHYGLSFVLAVFVMLLIFAHHAAGRPEEAKFAEYCLSKSGEAFAAFLGLITGAKMAGLTNGASPKDEQPSGAEKEKT